MIKDELSTQIIKKLGFTPTKDQETATKSIAKFILLKNNESVREPIYLLRGYAGTGKTSLISAMVKVLKENKQKVILLAPTGRAAKVFSSYSGYTAFTIHKKIYRQKSSKEINSKFVLDKNLHKNTIFIIDEASMIGNNTGMENIFGSGNLLSDLIEFVYSGENCKLIFIGDIAQLPPVGLRLSPALREGDLFEYAKQPIVENLRDVVRQSSNSGILYNATIIRKKLAERKNEIPILNTENFNDSIKISGNELVDIITSSYDKYGLENVAVITRSNKQANYYNQGIRNKVLWYEDELTPNDLLMVVKNNYFWTKDVKDNDFIANGDIVKVKSIKKFEERYGLKFIDATIELDDLNKTIIETKLIIDVLYSETPSLSAEQSKALFYAVEETYMHLKSKKARFEAIRQDPYFNALQIKYAYAFTCHKSQGGQWDIVFIDPGFFKPDMVNIEYLRWMYTAITRAIKKVYFVNFNNVFFGE